MVWLRKLAPFVVAAIFVAGSASAVGSAPHPGPQTGTWSGYITGSYAGRHHILIVVNARETGGGWKMSNACHGSLALESISDGYHHYRRIPAHGSTCGAGFVDCLKRVGANLYDAVTSPKGGEWGSSGTLHRVRAK
jgi:hypothetical protein